MCNNLLRRLSKAQNTVLCGRISLFLARFLPLDDRSGLNLPAAVNTSNTTPIEDPEQARDMPSVGCQLCEMWCSLCPANVVPPSTMLAPGCAS